MKSIIYMALSHFKNSTAAVKQYEVVNPSLFEVTVTPPSDIKTIDSSLFLEHVRSVDGLDGLNPPVGTVTQKFKFAERIYAGGPESTHLELTINFSLNLDESSENYIYTSLRKWCNKVYNPMTGAMDVKQSYASDAKVIILQYNRDGSVWRRITLLDVFPGQITGMGSLSYEDVNAAQELALPLICDHWKEEVIGLPDYN